MRIFLLSLAALLFPVFPAFAHEGEAVTTNLAEADWVGPIAAIIIISVAIIVSRIIRKKMSRNNKILSSNI